MAKKWVVLFFLLLPASTLFAASETAIPSITVKATNNAAQETNSKKPQITSFKRKKIKESPTPTLSTFLTQTQSIAHLTNNSGEPTQTAISIRGFGDNAAANSLILLDGFPLTNPSLLAPSFNAIPLADIERIDIFQGSQGTLWGDQAVGGVVNIETRHPQFTRWLIDALFAAGTLNQANATIFMSDKNEKGYFFNAFGTLAQNNVDRPHSQIVNENMATEFGRDDASGSTTFYLQGYRTHEELPGGLTPEQFFNHERIAASTVNNIAYDTTWLAFLNKQILNDHWLLETRLSDTNTNASGFVFANFNSNNRTTRFSPRLIGSFQYTTFTLGYDGQLTHYALTQRQTNNHADSAQQNVYLQSVTPLLPTEFKNTPLDLTLGGRFATQHNDIETAPSITTKNNNNVFVSEEGLNFYATPAWTFFVRRDGNFSFPKANEETLLPANQTTLDTQQGVSYEGGTAWQNDRTGASLRFYRLLIHNEIAFNPEETPDQPFGAYNNLAKTRRDGVTLTSFLAITPRIKLNDEMNFVDPRFASGINNGNLIPAVPMWTGNVGVNIALIEPLHLTLASVYTGTRYPSNDVQNAAAKLNAYWLHNIALQYVTKHVIVSAEIDNVLNKWYATYAYYDPTLTPNTFYYPAPGRSYVLTIKLNNA